MNGAGEAAPEGNGRRWARRRNPLRRTSDRIEAGMTFVLLMTMLLVAPLAAWSIAGQTYRDEMRAAEWERRNHVPVTAELLRDAAGPDAAGPDSRAEDGMPAQPLGTLARWTGPDRTVRTGLVAADPGSRQGDRVAIWVDPQGALTGPPMRHNAGLTAVIAALLTISGIGIALYVTHRLVVRRLDRRRLRAWEQEWRLVEPGWRNHR